MGKKTKNSVGQRQKADENIGRMYVRLQPQGSDASVQLQSRSAMDIKSDQWVSVIVSG